MTAFRAITLVLIHWHICLSYVILLSVSPVRVVYTGLPGHDNGFNKAKPCRDLVPALDTNVILLGIIALGRRKNEGTTCRQFVIAFVAFYVKHCVFTRKFLLPQQRRFNATAFWLDSCHHFLSTLNFKMCVKRRGIAFESGDNTQVVVTTRKEV